MSFISTSCSNPCPICADTKGKCRSRLTSFTLRDYSILNDQLFLCMNMGEDRCGFKFTGNTRDGLWGTFISYELSNTLSNAWKTSINGKNRNRNKNRNLGGNQKPTTVKRDRKTNSSKFTLPIPQRHQAIASVLSQLSLTNTHHKALIKRGFTVEQIKQYGFKSVRYKQPLINAVSDRLAGIAPSGKHLTNKFSGLIVPIRDPQGLYLGWQYRLDRSSNCRYLWAASDGVSSHLAEYSELPLSFHFPDGGIKNHDYIALTEGLGFKPQLTANRFGLISLGASGGMFAVSPQLLKLYLYQASSILQTGQILLFPDAGAVRNPHVLKQYKRTIDLVESFGYEVKIAWWGQINKSAPDPDELEGNYQIISTEQFFYLGLKYSAFFAGKDRHNVVRQFLNLLQNTNNPVRLKKAIATFQSQYTLQFDLIKRICWQHLNLERKQFISQVFS